VKTARQRSFASRSITLMRLDAGWIGVEATSCAASPQDDVVHQVADNEQRFAPT
jgi:hypothetical protein